MTIKTHDFDDRLTITMAFLRVFSLFLCVFLVQGELHPLLQFVENVDKSERIIQGSPATSGQFPHQVHLVMRSASGSGASCGGSLISTRHVLTAAHCLAGMVSVNVRIGSISLGSGIILTSTNFVNHPQYNPSLLHNDLGIITLPQEVTVSSTVKPVRLQKQTELGVTHADVTASVSGFGLTANTGSISQTLRWVNLRIITNDQCAETYGSSIIISSTICAVGIQSTAQSTCSGDSGGPLVIRESDGEYTHIGVVSFVSSRGCDSGNPSGYVRSVHFLSWINQVTGIPIRP